MGFSLKTYLVAFFLHFAVVVLLSVSLFLSRFGFYLGKDFTAFDRISAWVIIVLTFPARNLANAFAAPPDWWMRSAAGLLVVAAASLIWSAAICIVLSLLRKRSGRSMRRR